jgi:hypothetical protein
MGLQVLLLTWTEPGSFGSCCADLDNRVKTLLDGLRIPNGKEVLQNASPCPDEKPFFCLLEDDAMVTSFRVTADRLLNRPRIDEDDQINERDMSHYAFAVITVRPQFSFTSLGTVMIC